MAHILCFGELLLRLGAPARELLLQSARLEVQIGGAEANVAVSLARLGHRVHMLGAIPDNALGIAVLGELRRHGVETETLLRRPGRMGLYFLAAGAGRRPSQVLYDRADSAFAQAAQAAVDSGWPETATHLHLSGVTPALGAGPAAATLAAARRARAAGMLVSFDGNFRASLWRVWSGDAPTLLRGVMAEADLLFADHRDIELVLGPQPDAESPEARFATAAAAAFAAFPHLQRIASTRRLQHDVDRHTLGAMLATRTGQLHIATPIELAGIVDRIGAGDAFAAGVMHALLRGSADAAALQFGLAAAALKHSIHGDFNLASEEEIDDLVAERPLDVQR